MIIEHIFYSAALAILVGMVFYKYTGRDPSWIIIFCAIAPDLDQSANTVLRFLGTGLLPDGVPVYHGTFHNIAFIVLFGIVIAFLLHPLGLKFFDSLFFSIIGSGAHLLEDAVVHSLVYGPGYAYLWPFSSEKIGLGLLPLDGKQYVRDFFLIANTEVLLIGVLVLIIAFLIRRYYERTSAWIRWYMPDTIYRKFFEKHEPGIIKN